MESLYQIGIRNNFYGRIKKNWKEIGGSHGREVML